MTGGKSVNIKKMLSVLIFLSLLLCIPAYAEDDAGSGNAQLFDNSDTINADTAAPLVSAFQLIRNVGTIFSVIGIAGSGIQLVSNTALAEKALKRILYILIALMALWLLPAAIALGRNIFGSGWNPADLH